MHTAQIYGPKPFSVFQRSSAERSKINVSELIRFGSAGVFSPVKYKILKLGRAPLPCVWRGVFDHVTAHRRLGTNLAELPAGGWYGIASIATDDKGSLTRFNLGPFGIGERFLIAGQSHAGNFNDALLTIEDPECKAVAYDLATGAWRIAHDPQPAWPRAEQSHWEQLGAKIARTGGIYAGGSIWPAALNELVSTMGIPVGVSSIVKDGSLLREWLPGSVLFSALAEAVERFAPFRAILWQVGETDAHRGTDSLTYIKQFLTIKTALEERTQIRVPWLLARSTSHPAVGVNAAGQRSVRQAIETICKNSPGVFFGPDMDSLGLEFRRTDSHSRHLTAEGQRRGGHLWATAIRDFLASEAADLDLSSTIPGKDIPAAPTL